VICKGCGKTIGNYLDAICYHREKEDGYYCSSACLPDVCEDIKHHVGYNKITRYEELGRNIGKLITQKQSRYGDSFHKSQEVIQILYPNGIKPDDYPNILTIIRILDKLFRIATNNDPTGESPWQDIAGYAMLALGCNEEDT
jgi:hypothetical protein